MYIVYMKGRYYFSLVYTFKMAMKNFQVKGRCRKWGPKV